MFKAQSQGSLGLSLDDEDGNTSNDTTGIGSVENKKADEENVYYTLSGVKVINLRRKVYILRTVKKLLYDEM